MEINSTTKIIGLLGNPVKHSFSPNIHNYLFKKYKLNNIYCCFEVEEKNLNGCMQGIKSLGMLGCNVTIPHKVNIINYLDEVDLNAKLIGAVNTIENYNGQLKGYNTDGIGFVKSILDQGHTLSNKKVMIIGAGGSCRSIAIQLASEGVKSIEIRNRSLNKAIEITNIISQNFNVEVNYSDEIINEDDLNSIDILINTTPIGMESDLCPIDVKLVPNNRLLICDIVYKPHNTTFIKWAKSNSLDVVHGIDMLINQALYAFYIWTSIRPNKEDYEYIKNLYKTTNQ